MFLYACRTRDVHQKIRYVTFTADRAAQWCKDHEKDLWHGYDIILWDIDRDDGTISETFISAWRETPFYDPPPKTLEERNADMEAYMSGSRLQQSYPRDIDW